MSYIKKRIEKNRTEDSVYRAAYDEEVESLALEKERRQEVMQHVSSVRKAKHVTQQTVAKAMKISQARVSQLERGVDTLSIDSFLKLLDVLGARMVIVTDDEITKPKSENRATARNAQSGVPRGRLL